MIVEVAASQDPTIDQTPFEVVERKGLGHPDTVCDLIAERVSYDLGHFYLKRFGRVLHYNVDKALLVGGVSEPAFGGGKIVEPAKFYLGDRAISRMGGEVFDLDAVIKDSISGWLNDNLRFLRLGENLLWKNEIREGSASLAWVEQTGLSNDTSVGVGFWPLSPLEEMTIAVEERLNSPGFKLLHPESGEDIKILSVRRGGDVEMIIACAFVDRFVPSLSEYAKLKEEVLNDTAEFVADEYGARFKTAITLNALDDLARGSDGVYLTVSGLSCESGDSGEVGRGNRVNGLISFQRPQTMEAWAGKNFKSHIGKIYSFAAMNLARWVVEAIPEVTEASVMLVGKIGSPVNAPAYVFGKIKQSGASPQAVQTKAASVLKQAIDTGEVFQPELVFHGFEAHNTR